MPLRLHAQMFLLGLQNNLIYRWNFLLRVMVSFVPLLGWLFFWRAVFHGQNGFTNYTYTSMMAYFILLIVIDTLTVPNEDDFQIAEDIREGQLNAYLLRPVPYRLFRWHLFASARFIHALFALVPLAIGLYYLRHYFTGIPWLENLPLALVATLGAAVLQFLFCFSLAMIAFWILEIGSITFIIYSVEYFLSGHLFPLDAMPVWMNALCFSLPFAYETYFPVALLIGHVQGAEVWQGFLWQWAWIGFFYIFSGVAWKLGLKKYTAVGG